MVAVARCKYTSHALNLGTHPDVDHFFFSPLLFSLTCKHNYCVLRQTRGTIYKYNGCTLFGGYVVNGGTPVFGGKVGDERRTSVISTINRVP